MKKVMLVDDVPIANFIMKKLIEKAGFNCEIFDFTFPEKAIASLKDINPDLIFLDLNMPVIDGWEFLNLMAENNFVNKVYIVTSSTSEFDMQQSKQYKNVAGFLVKPANLGMLTEILKHAN